MKIITATENDMDRIMEIELESLSPPWTHGGLLNEIISEKAYFPLAVEDDIILGFAILRRNEDEGELLQIAVAKEYRRRGVGDTLISAALDWAAECTIAKVFLQVRESNKAAIALYDKHSFTFVGRRKAYYTAPIEDSITMMKEL
jgi:ribosomal-protein-alanine N-acetyltransferase